MFLVGPEGFPAVGKIMDELVACTHGLLAKLKMVTSVYLVVAVVIVDTLFFFFCCGR